MAVLLQRALWTSALEIRKAGHAVACRAFFAVDNLPFVAWGYTVHRSHDFFLYCC